MTTITTIRPETERDAATTVQLGCVLALVLLHLVQVAAALAGLEPHPPADVVPMIVAMAALGVAAVPALLAGERVGQYLVAGFALVSMVGMGPHKLFLDNGTTIAPVALLGFAMAVTVVVAAHRNLRSA
ncbi:MAG: hypothetical protein AAGA17_07630 [Actinomycetota bacterium]